EVVAQDVRVGASGDRGDEAVLDGQGDLVPHVTLPRDEGVPGLEDDLPLGGPVLGEAGREPAGPVVPAAGHVDVPPLHGDGEVLTGDVGREVGPGVTGHVERGAVPQGVPRRGDVRLDVLPAHEALEHVVRLGDEEHALAVPGDAGTHVGV